MRTLPDKQPSRDKILDHAEALFARRGFAGVGLAELAEAAGLGKSSLFHHFRSKAQLYAAVTARILARIEDALMRSLAAGGTPRRRVERWIDVLVDVLGAHPTYARLLLRSLFEDDELGGDLPEEREANEILGRIVSTGAVLLHEGMEAGDFRKVSVPHAIQTLIGATVFHFASGEFGEEILRRPLFAPREIERRKLEVKAIVLDGLAPASAPLRRVR